MLTVVLMELAEIIENISKWFSRVFNLRFTQQFLLYKLIWKQFRLDFFGPMDDYKNMIIWLSKSLPLNKCRAEDPQNIFKTKNIFQKF